MISFDPAWLGLDVIQDSSPGDGLAVAYLPSIANDASAALDQLQSESSARSFMQDLFRSSAENMNNSGLVVSAWA